MRFWHVILASVLSSACGGGGGGGDNGPTTPTTPTIPPPVTTLAVSGLSPFSVSCGGAGGTNYVNAEVEPYLAVDPRDANHLIGVWQQDRWSNGSSRGTLTGVSFDGGATWTTRQVPFSQCEGGELLRATDPWVTIAPDGTAYQIAISTTGGTFATGSANAILVSRSADGGLTWSNPTTVIRDGAAAFNDKDAITADPTDARFVYAVWDRITPNNTGPTWFARTVDGGATWEAARSIYDPGVNRQTIANLVRVLPNGTLVNLLVNLAITDSDAVTDASLQVIRSTDHGASWSAPIRVSDFRPVGASDPTTGLPIRDGSIVPQMTVAPNGTIYVVWQDGRFTNGARDSIALSRSTDGGSTWSAPVRINSLTTVAAFTPQVHVRADGTIGVSHYDLRSDTSERATLFADYWLLRSADGGTTWTETHIDGPFDMTTAPDAGGYFLGDYMALASSGTTFLPFYVRTTGSLTNRNDVFIARVAASGGVAQVAVEAKAIGPSEELDRRAFDNLTRQRNQRLLR